MLDISAGGTETSGKVVALAVRAVDGEPPALLPTDSPPPPALAAEIGAYLADLERPGSSGTVNRLPRPGRDPGLVLLFGVGPSDAAGWRLAGAAVARSGAHQTSVTVALPSPADGRADLAALAAGAFAEGAWLASYRFRLAADHVDPVPKLRRITVTSAEPASVEVALGRARAVAEAVVLARDLTNAPSLQKSPAWFADRVANAAARRKGVQVSVLTEADLALGGFGGILAISAGSLRPPRLVQLRWRPKGAHTHVVLVGKGITFDTGGISLKPLSGMRLMRKDMGGAAAVCAAVLGAADLDLRVQVTALAPLAENMVSGSAVRPGDVVRHYGGLTTEVRNTDAEGRVVLGDALAYAARRLRPDLMVNLATLTGASHIALGMRTAALFTHDDELAAGLSRAGAEVGEPMWRMPLADEYRPLLASDVADLANAAPVAGEAGAVAAALYLREFTGGVRDRWAHIDMSAPSWADKPDGPLVRGATGWGVRMLLHWLATMA